MQNLISLYFAASLLGVSFPTVYQLIKKRELSAFKAGKTWKIYSADVEQYAALSLWHPL